jgi:hypothetical protein
MFDIAAHEATTPGAPGALEVLQRFLNLHEHVPGVEGERPPPPEMIRAFLVERGLLEADAPYTRTDHAHAMKLFHALHGRLLAGELGRSDAEHTRAIEEIAARAGFRLRFGGEPGLEPTTPGIDGALGRLLALLFVAEIEGDWTHMKECASPTCHSVFFDRSKNRSGKWCSMQTCGNKHKVRAWRERQRGGDAGGSSSERERASVSSPKHDADHA